MKVKGLQIKILIAENGYNNSEFADKIGITKAGLNLILKNQSTKMLTAVKIAKALNVPVTDLLAVEN